MATPLTPKEVADRLAELAAEIALLKTAIENQAKWAAMYRGREDGKNLDWLERRRDAMRELLVEPSPTRHNGGNGHNQT
jgi:hypothetical protein